MTLGLLCGALLVSPSVAAVDFALRGFGTLGAARSSDGSAELVRDLSQPHGIGDRWSLTTDSLLGVQANVRIRPDLDGPAIEGVVQAVSRYKYDGTYAPEIAWAFVRIEPDPKWALRIGRLGTEFFMLSDSRLVGYSYNTVRPLVDYYGTLPFSNLDGLDLAVVRPVAGGLLKVKLFGGQSHEQLPMGGSSGDTFKLTGSPLVGGYLDFMRGAWQVRFGQAGIRFAHDLPLESLYRALPAPTADELRVNDRWTQFSSLGVVYDRGPVLNQLMLSKTSNEHGTFQDTWAGYLILNYRIGDWTPFVGLSFAKSTAADLDHPLAPYTDLYQRDFHSDQRTLLLGARWDFHPNICLKAEVDVIRGRDDSKYLYRSETPDWDGSMTVMALSLDFVF